MQKPTNDQLIQSEIAQYTNNASFFYLMEII